MPNASITTTDHLFTFAKSRKGTIMNMNATVETHGVMMTNEDMRGFLVYETIDGKRTLIGKTSATSATEALAGWIRLFGGDVHTITILRVV